MFLDKILKDFGVVFMGIIKLVKQVIDEFGAVGMLLFVLLILLWTWIWDICFISFVSFGMFLIFRFSFLFVCLFFAGSVEIFSLMYYLSEKKTVKPQHLLRILDILIFNQRA